MPQITVKLPKPTPISYPILIENEIFQRIPALLKKLQAETKNLAHFSMTARSTSGKSRSTPKKSQNIPKNPISPHYLIITDHLVKKLYGQKLLQNLRKSGLKANLISIPPGEKSKTLDQVEKIAESMLKLKIARDDCILTLGGGVIGDLAGFAASVYMREIKFIQIPTTLLAMVDAGIGGKTGVNLKTGKNLIGSFHQPQAVFSDPNLLKTLPPEEFQNGLAEIIKHAAIKSPTLFKFLEKNAAKILKHQPQALNKIIIQSCQIKARIVEKDEKENQLRMLLNYGHTFGHALEKLTQYTLPHGHAVSIGINLINQLAVKNQFLSSKTAHRIKNLLQQYQLPTQLPPGITLQKLLKIASNDKKVRSGQINLVILKEIGKPEIIPLQHVLPNPPGQKSKA